MSVLTHLTNTVNNSKLAEWERTLIDTSVNTLLVKLNAHFNNVSNKFVFGSYDRRTILKRSKDPNSDVDVMVIFRDGHNFTPQTLMNRLRAFASTNYRRNEIYQSSPTVVLELGHIKFELVPAYKGWGGIYNIPAPLSSYSTWMSTLPNKMKLDLESKHRLNNYLIRDLIILMKYWNVRNGKIYSSYKLESDIVNNWYIGCRNLKDYFYAAVDNLSTWGVPAYKVSKVTRLKSIVGAAKRYERSGNHVLAELEINKVI